MEEQENTNRESQKKNDNTNKSAIIFAKELVINFRLLLIALGITLLFAVIFYIACYPTLTGEYGESKYDKPILKSYEFENLPSIRLGSFEELNQDIKDPSQIGNSGLKGVNNLKNDYDTTYNNALNVDNQPQPDPLEEFSNRANNMPIFLGKQSLAENVYKAISHDAAQSLGLTPGYSLEGYGESKYDKPILKSYEAENLPSIRLGSFKDDIKSKTLYCFIISIAALIGGRYIYKGVVWVNVTYKNSKPILINSKNKHPNIVNSNDNISNEN
jgi:hypothetical protein